ncbi:hypothetical protein PCANC_22215 [Puccinia coronata f. sp. avenae]|uniref:Trafficking protein particle complex subunit n=1 Tax=Puccinia coronata f. sp. avenae TaxID=200324 RepID=A0A2N5SCF0_9BASI|nr:hypothetical protein PCANC_22215 [Puccinia coronata f. sp. avenae]
MPHRHSGSLHADLLPHRSPLKPARPDPNVLQCVSPAISPMKEPHQTAIIKTDSHSRQQISAVGNLPFGNQSGGLLVGGEHVPNELESSQLSSSVLKINHSDPHHPPIAADKKLLDDHSQPAPKYAGLPFDEEAKLVYGVVFSLRNLLQKLDGKKEVLHGYTTSAYMLHILTTPSNHTFALFSSPMSESMAPALQTLWRTAWLDFVVRNPLVSIDSRQSGREIDNEMFRATASGSESLRISDANCTDQ